MFQLQCCGADGPSDWAASKYNNVDRNDAINVAVSNLNPFYNIPETCCMEGIAENKCDIARKLKVGGAFNFDIYQTVSMHIFNIKKFKQSNKEQYFV